jgi:hypothetical protein
MMEPPARYDDHLVCVDCDYRSVSPELFDIEQPFDDDTLCWPCSEERARELEGRRHLRGTKCRSANDYKTKAWADKAARRYEEQYAWAMESYRCQECDQWHLTKKSRGGLPVLMVEFMDKIVPT